MIKIWKLILKEIFYRKISCFMYNPFILYSLYAYKFLIKLDFLKFQFSYKTIYKNFWDDDIIVQ